MNMDGNSRVLLIGEGVVASELAHSYARLGFEPVSGKLEDARALHPALIVTATDQFDLDELRRAVEETGASVVPTIEASELTANRQRTRTSANDDLGLPTLEHEFVAEEAELAGAAERIGFPCVVKPGRSTAGAGQSVVQSPEELRGAYEAAREASPSEGVVVERYIEFDSEVTILAVRSVDPATGQLATWFCEPIGTRHREGRLVESWQPAPLPEAAMDNARSIAARITGALASCGIFSVEMFVSGDDVYFSQVTPRPSRDGLVTFVTQRIDEFDLQARATQQLPIDSTLVSPGAARFLEGHPSHKAVAAAMAVDEVTVRMVGDGTLVLATADSAAEARQRAEEAVREIHNVDGKPGEN